MSEPDAAETAPRTTRASRRRERTKSRWLRKLAWAMVAVLVVAIGATVYAYFKLNGNITRISVDDAVGTNRPTAAAGALNILLLGSDTREGDGNTNYGDGSWEPGAHSDTTLVLHLAADRTSATVVSIPRDSMTLAPPECSATAAKSTWTVRQWNKNYSLGGPGCLIRTLEELTGLYIHHFAVVDFNGFKGMVDALGGVPVCTKDGIKDVRANLDLSPGRHVLNGEQALGYVRARYSLGDGSDLGRIKRQQAFLSSVAQEATRTSLLLRPDKLFGFLDAATQSLTTDESFSVGTMQDIATSVKSLGINKIKFVTVPTRSYQPDPNRVEWTEGANAIWQALKEDRPVNSTPKPKPTPTPTDSSPLTVSPTKISVTVINASGQSGLAASAASALRVQGFANVGTGNAALATQPAVVRYATGSKEAARTVAAAFPGATLEEVAGLGATIQVVLGPEAPAVVEIPNRVGTDPLPTPSATPSPSTTIEERSADQDICS